MYQPKQPFITPMMIYNFTTSKINGVEVKEYDSGHLIYGTVRTFTGTESVKDNVYIVESTAVIDTWYDPTVKAGSKVTLLDDSTDWEVIGTPDDIERKHRYIQFKVKRLSGGA